MFVHTVQPKRPPNETEKSIPEWPYWTNNTWRLKLCIPSFHNVSLEPTNRVLQNLSSLKLHKIKSHVATSLLDYFSCQLEFPNRINKSFVTEAHNCFPKPEGYHAIVVFSWIQKWSTLCPTHKDILLKLIEKITKIDETSELYQTINRTYQQHHVNCTCEYCQCLSEWLSIYNSPEDVMRITENVVLSNVKYLICMFMLKMRHDPNSLNTEPFNKAIPFFMTGFFVDYILNCTKEFWAYMNPYEKDTRVGNFKKIITRMCEFFHPNNTIPISMYQHGIPKIETRTSSSSNAPVTSVENFPNWTNLEIQSDYRSKIVSYFFNPPYTLPFWFLNTMLASFPVINCDLCTRAIKQCYGLTSEQITPHYILVYYNRKLFANRFTDNETKNFFYGLPIDTPPLKKLKQ